MIAMHHPDITVFLQRLYFKKISPFHAQFNNSMFEQNFSDASNVSEVIYVWLSFNAQQLVL